MTDKQILTLTRQNLYDRVWSEPVGHLAKEFGTSSYHVTTLCRRLAVPLPAPGHWQQAGAGKASPRPPLSADPDLDRGAFTMGIAAASARLRRPTKPTAAPVSPPASGTHGWADRTRTALTGASATGANRVSGGKGRFRVTVSAAAAPRVVALLDSLCHALTAAGWTVVDGERGLDLVPDGMPIGFALTEKTDPVPHEPTAAELREKAEYDRKCALADRGLGYRPWGPPKIPEFDYVPNGLLLLKLDDGLHVEGLRRTFSDGKRQRLEHLIDDIVAALACWAAGNKAHEEEWARIRKESENREEQRRAAEQRARTDGYRSVMVARLDDRLQELTRIERLLAYWEGGGAALLAPFTDWMGERAAQLRAELAPAAVAARIAEQRLMRDDIWLSAERIS